MQFELLAKYIIYMLWTNMGIIYESGGDGAPIIKLI